MLHGDRTVFHPELEMRGFDDPVLRFVAAMCKVAIEVERGAGLAAAWSGARQLLAPLRRGGNRKQGKGPGSPGP